MSEGGRAGLYRVIRRLLGASFPLDILSGSSKEYKTDALWIDNGAFSYITAFKYNRLSLLLPVFLALLSISKPEFWTATQNEIRHLPVGCACITFYC